MLDLIIPFLNVSLQELPYIQQSFGLAELKSDGEMTLPQEYQTKGQFNKDLSNFDNYKGLTYWRKRGEVLQTQDEDPIVACETIIERSYQLRLVAVIPKKLTSKDDSFTADRIANDIVKKLTDSNASIKSTLEARMVDIEVVSYNTDSANVLQNESFSIADTKYDLAVLSLDVNFDIQISPDCLAFSCPTVSDFVCSIIEATPSVKIKECLDASGKTTEVCGNPAATLIYAFPANQSFASFRLGDEYDMWDTEFVGNMNTFGTLRQPTADRSVLDGNNEFGHTFRFTGTTGGYYDHLTQDYKDVNGVVTTRALAFPDEYLIDQYTGLGWSLTKLTVSGSQNVAIDKGYAHTAAGFSDFYLASKPQMSSIQQQNSIAQAAGERQSMAWVPFDDNFTTNPEGYYWTSTRRADISSQGITAYFGGMLTRNTGDNWHGWAVRKHHL